MVNMFYQPKIKHTKHTLQFTKSLTLIKSHEGKVLFESATVKQTNHVTINNVPIQC